MKRVLATALVGVCVVVGLAACKSNPQVAAYVNGDVISEDQVDAILDDAKAAAAAVDKQTEAATGAPASPQATVPSRSNVVSALVFDRTCSDQQAKEGFAPGQVTVDDIVSGTTLPATSQFVALQVHLRACLYGAFAAAPTTATPTEAQLRDIYDRAIAGGATGLVSDSTGAVVPFEQWMPQFVAANSAPLSQYLSEKNAVDALIASGDLTVNPRYRPIELVYATAGDADVPLIVSTFGQPGDSAVS